jgi:HEAT repeat protein
MKIAVVAPVVFALGVAVATSLSARHHSGVDGASSEPTPKQPSAQTTDAAKTPAFTLKLVSDVRSDDASVFKIDVAGAFRFDAMGESLGRKGFAARLSDTHIDLSPKKPGQDAERAALKASLEEACYFAIDERGTVVEVRFDPKSNSLAQSLVRGVITAMQFVRADADEDSWIAEELDTTGRYRAKYRRDGAGRYVKQKLEYVQRAQGSVGPAPKTSVKSSHSVFAFEGDELVRFESEERVDTSAAGLPPFHATTSITLAKSGVAPLADVKALGELFAGWVPSRPDDVGFVAEMGPSRDFDLARIAGQTFESIVKELERASAASNNGKAVQDRVYVALVSLLRQDEAARAAAADYVVGGKGANTGMVLDALRDAGTGKAQDVFLGILDRVQPAVRLAIVQRLSGVGHPTPDTVSRLVSALRDPALRVQAEFGLGAAVHALRSVDPSTAGVATHALLAELERSREPTDVANTLAALGTAGQSDLLPTIAKYVHDESVVVRAAAGAALRRISGDKADALLVSILESDSSERVRSEALHAARQRTPSERVMSAVEKVSRNDKASTVRLEALALLGNWIEEFPRGRETVVFMAAHDTDEKVREAAKAQLAAWKEAS